MGTFVWAGWKHKPDKWERPSKVDLDEYMKNVIEQMAMEMIRKGYTVQD